MKLPWTFERATGADPEWYYAVAERCVALRMASILPVAWKFTSIQSSLVAEAFSEFAPTYVPATSDVALLPGPKDHDCYQHRAECGNCYGSGGCECGCGHEHQCARCDGSGFDGCSICDAPSLADLLGWHGDARKIALVLSAVGPCERVIVTPGHFHALGTGCQIGVGGAEACCLRLEAEDASWGAIIMGRRE